MAFKQLYECEFCGKTKYFFPEQAIGAKCECETNIDLNNTWCEATKKIYEKLISLYPDCGKFYRLEQALTFDAFIIKNNSFSLNSNRMSDLRGDAKQIHLVNGEFQYVETKPKNNFKDYGFEADFEGEILKEVKELKGIEYLGYFVGNNKTHYPCIWTKSGRIWKT